MDLGAVLADIGQRLAAAGVPYMVTGSVAGSFHGEPRSTLDVDVVIDPTPETLTAFVEAIPADQFYVDLEAARIALAERTQFNAIHQASGWKVDLIVRKDRPFSIEEFARRRPAELLGAQTVVVSAEDLIIAKLEWARAAESERQLRDVAAIVALQGDALDRDYIERWVSALGLDDGWREVRSA
jgi:hypothetical protein